MSRKLLIPSQQLLICLTPLNMSLLKLARINLNLLSKFSNELQKEIWSYIDNLYAANKVSDILKKMLAIQLEFKENENENKFISKNLAIIQEKKVEQIH